MIPLARMRCDTAANISPDTRFYIYVCYSSSIFRIFWLKLAELLYMNKCVKSFPKRDIVQFNHCTYYFVDMTERFLPFL